MNEELLKGLRQEQIEKARKCKSTEELIILAKEEGVSLTDEQLAAVNGGCGHKEDKTSRTCPQCGAMITGEYVETTPGDGKYHFICTSCGYEWDEK